MTNEQLIDDHWLEFVFVPCMVFRGYTFWTFYIMTRL